MNSKSTVTLKKLVMAALFAALACVATMSIKIPTPEQADIFTRVMRLLSLLVLFSDLHGDSSQAVSDLLWQTCSEDILSMFRSHL